MNPEHNSPSMFPAWKKTLLFVALLVGIVGVLLPFVMTAETKSPAYQNQPQLPALGFSASGVGAMTAVPETETGLLGIGDWSSLLTQVGFSFVVGFCIGLALAFFLKTTAIIAGVIFLSLFGLQYVGLVDVNWSGLQNVYDGFIAWLQPHASSFKAFIGSHLPSAGLAFAGLITGLKKT